MVQRGAMNRSRLFVPLALAVAFGFCFPWLLYRHSSFIGWSAPKGGETITLIVFVTLLASVFILATIKKSSSAIRAIIFFGLGATLGFFAPWLQSDPWWYKINQEVIENNQVKRVAHAGGSIDGLLYTNSIESLELNKQYFDYFEIDLSLTSDGQVVCLHGWNENIHSSLFGRILREPLPMEDFQRANQMGLYTACDLDSLEEWVDRNPQKRIITDVKVSGGGNLDILRMLAKKPALRDKAIPQVYSFEEVDSIGALGFDEIILTTYRMKNLDQDNFLDQVASKQLFAVTVTKSQAGNLSSRLSDLGVPVYVHTVNNLDWFAELRKMGVSNVYTDTLSNTIEGY